MISRIGSDMAKDDSPSGVDDEHPRQLSDIADRPADTVSLAQQRHRLEQELWREEAGERGLMEAIGRIKAALWVGNHGKRQMVLTNELRRFCYRTHADQYQPCTCLQKLVFSEAQLRHLLPAECSAEVTQKNQYQRPDFP